MKNRFPQLISFMFVLLAFYACNKDDETSGGGATTGSFKLVFNNYAGSSPLNVTGDSLYVNSSGENFTVTKFKYYISNIALVKSDGSLLTLPADYFLIDQGGNTGNKRTLSNIPTGSYKGVRFLIGVDSAKTVQGAQLGDLDPINGMVWDWNTGYIFVKLEGKSDAAGTVDSSFAYHISGYRTSNNTYALHWVDLSFGSQPLVVSSTGLPELHLKTDVLEMFQNPLALSIADNPIITSSGSAAVSISNNYADMFTFDHIQN